MEQIFHFAILHGSLLVALTIHPLTLFPYRFKVEDAKYAKDTLAAWACIRLDRLQQGYRFIHLIDCKGLASEGLLLVKIEKSLRLLGVGTPHPTMPALMPNLTHVTTAPALVGGMGPLQRVDCGLEGRR